MAPQEEFWNLKSKHREKKEFYFYDKMVPQPFKTTPSATLTPTPTPSSVFAPDCIYFDVTGNTWDGTYIFFGYGKLSVSGSTYTLENTGNYAIYYNIIAGNTTLMCQNDLYPGTVVMQWISGIPSYGQTADALQLGIKDSICYNIVGSYRVPCLGLITSETRPYTATNVVCPTPTPTPTQPISPTPTPSPINANGFKLSNSPLESGDMNGTYILARNAYYDQIGGTSGGLAYSAWLCVNPATATAPYGNLYKNINTDDKFIMVEAFAGGNIVRLYKGQLISQIPSDPNNPFSCNTRLYNVSRDYVYSYPSRATQNCGYAFPIEGSNDFGDIEWLSCIP